MRSGTATTSKHIDNATEDDDQTTICGASTGLGTDVSTTRILEELLCNSRSVETKLININKRLTELESSPCKRRRLDADATYSPDQRDEGGEVYREMCGDGMIAGRRERLTNKFRQQLPTTSRWDGNDLGSTVREGDEPNRTTNIDEMISKLQFERATMRRDTASTRMSVSDLLRASVPSQRKGNIADFQPFKFVERGEKCSKISQGEATLPEYLDALFIMIGSEGCPVGWGENMRLHVEDIVRMSTVWDWKICRRWSERLFKLLVEGRVKGGWNNVMFIKNLQRDMIALGQKTGECRTGKVDAVKRDRVEIEGENKKQGGPFDREKDGKPCFGWNWGKECGFKTHHGADDAKIPHICAWCAYRYKTIGYHAEKDCYSKQRYNERKGEGVGQGFQ